MTKEQFIAGCVMCGYCTKRTAIIYAADKDELTEADFEEAYRIEQERKSKAEARKTRENSRYRIGDGCRVSKKYHKGRADKYGAGLDERG